MTFKLAQTLSIMSSRGIQKMANTGTRKSMVSWTWVTHQTREAPVWPCCILQLERLGKSPNPSLRTWYRRGEDATFYSESWNICVKQQCCFSLFNHHKPFNTGISHFIGGQDFCLLCISLHHQHHPWHT